MVAKTCGFLSIELTTLPTTLLLTKQKGGFVNGRDYKTVPRFPHLYQDSRVFVEEL